MHEMKKLSHSNELEKWMICKLTLIKNALNKIGALNKLKKMQWYDF